MRTTPFFTPDCYYFILFMTTNMNKPKKKKSTDVDKRKLVDAWIEGKSFREIGKEYNRSYEWARKIVRASACSEDYVQRAFNVQKKLARDF